MFYYASLEYCLISLKNHFIIYFILFIYINPRSIRAWLIALSVHQLPSFFLRVVYHTVNLRKQLIIQLHIRQFIPSDTYIMILRHEVESISIVVYAIHPQFQLIYLTTRNTVVILTIAIEMRIVILLRLLPYVNHYIYLSYIDQLVIL